MRSIRALAIILFVVITTLDITAQSARVTGQVVDQAKAPVAGAVVVLRDRSTGFERTALTDAEGKFSFDVRSGATFDLTAVANGFGRSSADVPAAGGSVTLTLEPSAITEQVTVTATRTQILESETAVPVNIVDREEIERKAVNTVGDIFRTLPGTSSVNEGAFQVRPSIRGLDSNRVLILVDGERLNNSRTSTGQSGIESGLVETSQIQTVEVARGSGSVLYGTDALAGTINIITRDTPPRRDSGFRFGAALDTFYSSNENGRRGTLAVTGSNKFFAFRVAQSLERFDNYFTGKTDGRVAQNFLDIGGIGDDGEVLNSQSHGSNSQATLRFFINDTNTLRANYERRRAANIGSPTLIDVFNAFFPFSNRDKVSLRWDSAGISTALDRLSVSGFYQTQFRNFTNILTVPPFLPFFPGQYQFSETVTDTKTAGFDLQTNWNLGSRNRLTAGTSFFTDHNSDRRLIVSASTPTSSNPRVSNTRSVPDARLTNYAFFAQDEFAVSSRLKLIGGIRVDHFRTEAKPTSGFVLPTLTAAQIEDLGIDGLDAGLGVSNTAFTGDIGAVFRVTKNVNLSARLGRSFRTPNIFERFFTDLGSIGGSFVVGNPGLKPESGINFDTSVKIHTSRFAGNVTYFRNSYSNFLSTVESFDRNGDPILIPRAGTSPLHVYQTKNIDKARIQGLEAEFEVPFKISLGILTPNGNFSYLRGDNLGTGGPLNFISPFRTNLGIRWQNFGKNYYFDYNMRIVARQDRLTDDFLLPSSQGGNDGPEPGFVTHDLGGGYYFRHERYNFGINLGISNIFGRLYNEQFVYAPARGRSFTIGTTWEIR